MKILITAGPTREAIDAVRYIGNRSSGRMGAALAQAAMKGGHQVTMIVGPGVVPMPPNISLIDIETARQMHDAVMEQFPRHDLLIMAAAVADYRPKAVRQAKIAREESLTIECEPTEDIVAAAGTIKRADQRTVGFSLETRGNEKRAEVKLHKKGLDLIVFNPIETMDSPDVEAVLLRGGGAREELGCRSKAEFADILLQRCLALFA